MVDVFLCIGIANAEITVGTCKSEKNPYLTISSAILASPPNGVIQVCPGTYPEQLLIQKPISLNGLLIAGRPGVTITSPAGKVASGPNGFYSLIDIEKVIGPVNLKNLSIQNVVANLPEGYSQFCGYIPGFELAAVLYQNSAGTVEGLNINNVFLPSESSTRPDIGLESPCGVGIDVYGDPSQVVTIRSSSISDVGYAGIYSTGTVIADFNMISLPRAGYFSIGIKTAHGEATRNTITLANCGPGLCTGSVGIQGGDIVKGNFIQYAETGVSNADHVSDNALLNNGTGVIGNTAALNLVYAPPTYYRTDTEYCLESNNPTLCSLPTSGINLNCLDGSQVRENAILNVGIGVANVESDTSFSSTNVISGVGTTSTGCAQ